MKTLRSSVIACLPTILILFGASARAQMAATITLEREDSTTILRQACEADLQRMPEGVRTSLLTIRVVEDDSLATAPADLTVLVRGKTLTLSRGDTAVTERVDNLKGEWIDIQAGANRICSTRLPTEVPPGEPEGRLEVDDAFQLLAGVEYISIDAFQEREVHIPAAARWTIPIRVIPHEDAQRTVHKKEATGTASRWGWLGWLSPSNGHIYSIASSTAEYTRIPNQRDFFSCTRATTVLKSVGQQPPTTEACGVQTTGDTLVGFTETRDSADYTVPSTWRIYGNFRWEGNIHWADNDVFFGPAVTVGFQTDPGRASPDFFPLVLGGVSMTQVEIEPEYFVERFQLQVLLGRSPNYAEDIVIRSDTTQMVREEAVTRTPRWYVQTSFQPITGYFVRGTAEFGRGGPDIARFALVTQLDLEDIIRGILGRKDPLPRQD